MTIDQILAELSEKKLALAIDGDELIVRGARAALDAPLVALLRENKADLVDSVRSGKYVDPLGLAVTVPPNGILSGCVAITPEMLLLAQLNIDDIESIVAMVPGGTANVQDIYGLAPLQEGILFHHRLSAAADPYVGASVYRFENRARLHEYLDAVQAVIDRHDILRTAVLWEGLSEPVQVVLRSAPLSIEEVSIDASDADVAVALAARCNGRRYRLDIRRAPLLHAFVARQPRGDGWALALIRHHLIGDNTSFEVMEEEIRAHLLDGADDLAPPQPFRNFVAQARLGVRQAEHEQFFSQMLADVEEPTVPFGLIDAQGDGSNVRQTQHVIDAQLVARLRSSARASGVSLASVCHVAWACVVARLSGRNDVVFGTVLFGRMHGAEGTDRALGMFLNTLPLRIRIDDRGVRASIEQTHVLLAQLLRHEHATLALAQRCSAVAAPTPLFSSLLNYRHGAPKSSVKRNDPWTAIDELEDSGRTNFPLGISVNDHGDELSLSIDSDASIDADRISAYLETALLRLAEALDHSPMRPLASIDILPVDERQQLLVTWNAGGDTLASDRCVHEIFEKQVALSSSVAAVECGGLQLTYRELNARANRLAAFLRRRGVVAGTHIGLCVERSFEMVVAMLAVWKAGAAYVPLDPAYPMDRLAYIIGDSAPRLILTHNRTPPAVRSMLERITASVVDLHDHELEWSHESADNLDRSGLTERDVAYVIYTSGSTGYPKGVMVEHRQLVSRLFGAQTELALGAGDVFPNVASAAFDISLLELLLPIISGGRTLLIDAADVKDLSKLRELTADATVFHAVPSLMAAWLESLDCGHGSYASLNTLLVGGEAVPERLLSKLMARFPKARVFELYGPTEATIISSTYRADRCSAPGVEHCIGRPLPDTRMYIVDARMEPAPIGVAGELHIGGSHIARGYLNRAELTAERFIDSPFVAGDRLYKTGDVARYLPDGNIEFLGRNDFQVKVRGFRIELGEIELRLTEYPGVREAVIVALDDVDAQKRLVAYYTVDARADVRTEALRTRLLSTLPDYMVPAHYVQLDALPLTINGKIDRKSLPAPDGETCVSRAYEAPSGVVESTIAAIWRELLKLDRIGRHDNFFELGGHSLLAIRALERLRRIGVYIEATDLFAAPTLSALALATRAERVVVEVPPNGIPSGCTSITPEMLPLIALSDVEIASIVDAVPGGAANIQDIYPLASLQQGMLFHHLLGGEGDPYLHSSVYRFESRARLDAYLGAFQAMIDRHDILRTAMLWEGLPEPAQVVLRHARLSIEEIALDTSAGDAGEQLASRFSSQRYRLDVRKAPIVSAFVARDVGDGWVMLLVMHHLLGDHTSLELMREEMRAHLSGMVASLPAPQPLRNFIAQSRMSISREEHEMFFHDMLADVTEPTAPFGLTNVQGNGSSVHQTHQDVDRSVTDKMRLGARALGVSAASICHVAWAQVLARVSDRNDVVFGTVLFGRMQAGAGADRTLGMFMNTLPVRIRVDERGVRASVEQTHRLLARLLRHEHAPLALAQRCSGVAASAPLFSSLLNYRHISGTGSTDRWEGLSIVEGDERTNYPFGISVNDFGDALSLSVKTDISVDADRLCTYMQTALHDLVDALEMSPSRALADIDILPKAERRQLVVDWNATDRAFKSGASMAELFERQVVLSPDAVAVEQGETQLTYGELNARSNHLARYLRSLGVGRETRVAVCLDRRVELLVSVFAIWKAGGAYVPLDPAYPVDRLLYQIEDSAPVVLLCDPTVSLVVNELRARTDVAVVDVGDAWRWSDESSANLDRAGLSVADVAYVIYTSGSTGRPKGVMVEQGQLVSRLLGAQAELRLDASDIFPNLASSAFDISLLELLLPLVAGGRTLLVASVDVKELAKLRALTSGATVFHAVPSLMEAWLESLDSIGNSYDSLKTLLVGGEAVPERLLGKLRARFPAARVIELYGPTEATMISTAYRADGATQVAHCIGRPLPNTRTYIVGARLAPAPIGVAGELYIGGDQVARGYLNRAELTAERFVASPFVVGDRLYKTGDLARYLADGNIEFLGRNDFQVKIRGFRIELGEIESRLRAYPGVREAVVVALDDAQGEKRLVAYYTTAADASDGAAALTVEELRSHLLSVLPDYMVPAAYVGLAALPVTVNGKLDRKALPAPDDGSYVSHAYEPPVGDIELALAAIWRELLKVERVGRQDNFFELGGHSLLVVVALERLRRIGLHIEAADLFAAPTLSALALATRSESLLVEVPPNAIPANCSAITPAMLPLVTLTAAEIASIVDVVPGGAANVQDIYPLAPLQEGILFHHLLGGEGDPYLGCSVYRFANRARLDAYVDALRAVIDRHDILRTAIIWEGLPEPVQVVLRNAPLIVEEAVVDAALGDVADVLSSRFDRRRYRLNLGQAPLMRATIAQEPHGVWVLVLVKHHLLGDHTAMEVMHEELLEHLAGTADRLPAAQPFRNFIAQSRLGISQSEHETFFRELLGDVTEPTAPFGLTNVQGDGSNIRQTWQVIDPAFVSRLRSRARLLGVSLASVCHVAWATVLARVSGRSDVVFGTILFGRMQGGDGAHRTLGMFMNTLPVRIAIDGLSVRESVEQTHMLLARLLRHEHAPLALAQRCSGIAGTQPLFSALLNYRHGAPKASVDRGESFEFTDVSNSDERTNYPFGVSVNDHGDEVSLSVKSDASVDPDRLCAYMQTALQQIVDALERTPARALADIDVLPKAERRQLVVDWNATDRAFESAASMAELFERQVVLSPDAVAVEQGETQLTYGELNARSNHLARYLRSLGVGRETRVAVCLDRRVELLVSVFAIWKAGGAYVPLDPAYPVDRLLYQIEDSAPVALLCDGSLSPVVNELRGRANVAVVDIGDVWRWSDESSANLDRAGLSVADVAYVIYTSGSTGRPKGVMVEQGQLVSRLLGAQAELRLDASDIFPNLASSAFDISLLELLLPLVAGGRTLLVAAADVKELAKLRALTSAATVFHAVPSLMEAWLESLDSIGDSYGSLKTLLVGGEAVPERLLGKLRARFPAARVIELYGPTEATMISTTYRADGATQVAHCIGRPLPNTRTYIVGAGLAPAPIGVAGELYIGGDQVARGYLNRADLTAERFVASPFVAGDRLYKTGDLARYLADGNIEFLGRNDFQVKIRGFRIELGEIESRLRAYPGVREAVVVALDDAQGKKRLVAYYTTAADASDAAKAAKTADGAVFAAHESAVTAATESAANGAAAVTVEELRSHLLSVLPDYMVPAAYAGLAALPLTVNGKLDRKALPAPDDGSYVSHAYEPPVGDIELALAAIWRELLKVERVGRQDNFFELGGHSLLVVVALERLRRIGLHIEAADLFAAPTLSALALATRSESLLVEVPPNAIPANCSAITPAMLPLVTLTAAEIASIVDVVPGGAANVQDIYPLAPLQEGILFHHLLGGEGDPYLGCSAYRFANRSRLDAYLGALQAVIDRHDILRTAIVWEGLPEPVQVVLRNAPLIVEEAVVDAALGDVAGVLSSRFDRRRYRLNLGQAPLMRATIAQEPHGVWVLVLVKHHLLGDHTAMEVMHEELLEHLAGTADQLPAAQPFRNFIAQSRLGISQSEHETFFRELLGDVTEPTAPFGLTNVQGDGSNIRQTWQVIDPAFVSRLRSRARLLGVSLASVCHVAWATVLARVSGRSDVVFGTILFGRMQGGDGAHRTLGMFMNTLPVRIAIDGLSVRESVEQTHMLLARLLRHEHAPLALAQRCSGIAGTQPLFSALLNYRHGAPKASVDRGESFEYIDVSSSDERTNYPFGVSVNDHGDEVSLSVKSDASVDPDRLCAYMHTALQQIVDALERTPARALAEIDVLPKAERRELIVEWNATDRSFESAASMAELFERQVVLSPDAVAVEQGETQLTYGELNARSNRLARYLRSLGVGRETRVAVCLDRRVELLVSVFAIWKAGGAYVPLDPAYPVDRLLYQIQDSALVALLCDRNVSPVVTDLRARADVAVVDVGDVSLWSDESSANLDRAGLSVADVAYVIYTSGSTGHPKGVMVEQGQLVSRLLGAQAELRLDASDIFPNLASSAFDISLLELLLPLVAGGRTLLVAAADVKELPKLRALTSAATIFHAVPSLMEAWLESLDSQRNSYDLLKTLLVGGEAVPERLLGKLRARFPAARVIELYGPTEATMISTAYRADGAAPSGVAHCIGRPLPNTRTYIVGAGLAPAPIGVAGELYIGGDQVARGYLNRADLTAERFVASPFVAGDRLYKTGDLARYLADGNIEFLGRNDFQVKIRGFRIELGEIESRLRAYPSVREAVVVALDDAQGEKRLVAYYTTAAAVNAADTANAAKAAITAIAVPASAATAGANGVSAGAASATEGAANAAAPGAANAVAAGAANGAAAVTVEELRSHLLSVLPDYMVPAAYVGLAALPLTVNGKLDRKALPAPDDGSYVSHAYEPPVGDIELELAAIWRELLKVERVGRQDNFFELGGHSLLVVVALERLRRIGLHIEAADLFAAPTLSALALATRSESLLVEVPPNAIPANCSAITPAMLPLVTLTAAEIASIVDVVPGGAANVQDIYPLAPLQEGILFHHLLGGEGDPYLGCSAYRFANRSRLDAYLGALQAVIDRHDILRTAIIWEGLPEPVQVVLRNAPLIVEEAVVDAALGDVADVLSSRFDRRRYRLNLGQAPLMRAIIASEPHGVWVLVLVKHHLLGDHTAMEVMHEELLEHLAGTADRLPAAQPFRNFIAQSRLGISQSEHETFFRELLGDVTEPTAPFGLTNVQGDGSNIRQTWQVIDPAFVSRLRSRARLLGVSLASVCHVAWATVLARVSGRSDVVFGTILFGRMQGGDGAHRTLGMFMNTLPVRIAIDGLSVRESVEQTHMLLARLMRHEHAPLALAQRCSGIAGTQPLFSSLLNYRHGAPKASVDRGESFEYIDVSSSDERTNYPFGVSVNDHGDEVSLSVKTDISVDADRLCMFMQTALHELVNALETSPSRALADIDILPKAERRQLVVEWNATDRSFESAASMAELFERQVVLSPDAVAVEQGETQLTYGELNARSNRLALYLRSLGVGRETRVAVCLDRRVELLVSVFAIWKAGGAYVPLDPAYPVDRLLYQIEDSAPVVLLCDGSLSPVVNELRGRANVAVVDIGDVWRWSDESSANLDRAGLSVADVAYVIYTSGSTGRPKGVMVEQGQLVSRLLGAQAELRLDASDIFPNLASSAFDISLLELLLPLVAGGRTLLVTAADVKELPKLRALTSAATVFHAVPSLMEAWLESLDSIGDSYGSLKTLLVGGEAVPERLLGKLRARFPAARVIELYGPTEATMISTTYRADGATQVAHCIGRPLPNTRTYIVGAGLAPAPIGVVGELYIGGDQVARGYLNRADLTAERFMASPFVVGDRLYKTGDLARYLADGNIEFLGRNDFQVKIRGFRIELGEIESRLRAYPGVREAVVVALDDAQGEKRLVAYYTTAAAVNAADTANAAITAIAVPASAATAGANGVSAGAASAAEGAANAAAPGAANAVAAGAANGAATVTVDELRSHLLSVLPDYMVPAAYVGLAALPLTVNGKLDRKALPAPDDGSYVSHPYEPPVGDIELALAAIWRELLKVERVGRQDNFFELGGHSLLVVVALERLRRIGLHIEAADLFAAPTLSALALATRSESLLVEVPPNAIPANCSAITPAMLPLVTLTAAEIASIVDVVPGGATNVQDIYPLAPLQEGILFHHLLGGEGDPYLGCSVYRFANRARLDAYVDALRAVIDRHDILRTAIVWEGLPEPVQVVLRNAPLIVEEAVVDAALGDVADVLSSRFNPRHYRLDVRQAPLLRTCIAPENDGDGWVMIMLRHHLWGDHTAMEVMQHELQAHLLGNAAELQPAQPFRNFVAQARLGVSKEEHEAFFREMLAGIDQPTAPFGYLNVQGDGSNIRQTWQVIDPPLVTRLRATARSLGVTTASICHVAWAAVLARVSGHSDVVFGTLLFGRMHGGNGADRALGMFLNTLPVRIRVDDRGVREGVEQTHLLLARLLRHEHAPLALAQRCSGVAAPTPLFSSLMNYRHGADKKKPSDVDAMKGIRMRGGQERTNYPFGLSVNDHGTELSLSVQSIAAIDPDRLGEYMQTALRELIEALEKAPNRSLSSIEVLPELERQALLYDLNATHQTLPTDAFVHEMFEAQVAAAPDAIAVEYNGTSLTYAQLNTRTNRLAWHLRSIGIGPDTRVAVCLERSFEMIVALLAILKSGGGYVPLDPAYPVDRLAYVLQDSAPAVVLTGPGVEPAVRDALLGIGIPVVNLHDDVSLAPHESATNLDRSNLSPRDIAYIIYTSGSTGYPKGVMIEHGQFGSRLLGAQSELGLGPADIFPNLASSAFDISLLEVLLPLVAGGRTLLVDSAHVKDLPKLHELTRHATVFHAVPSFMEVWLESLNSNGDPYSSLKTLLVGGEAVSERLLIKLAERFPESRVIELYGPTEATIISTTYRVDRDAHAGVPHCIGRPLPNTRTYIVDARMQPVPIGAVGELYVGGNHIARGYLNRQELTADRFVESPYVEGDRLYKTGDVARYLPDGNIEFLGRNDFQVKIRGFRIELGEIEACLAHYPGVRSAVILALDNVDGEKRLVAYYTVDAAADVRVEAIRRHLLSILPDYMVPAAYVQLDALPLTINGKLDRKALPAPDAASSALHDYDAPLGDVELALAAIWCEVLKLERVSRQDNFFELGGHSLSAMRVLSRVRTLLQIEINLRTLFAQPTLQALAQAVSASKSSALPTISIVNRNGTLPLSFAQERLWFLAQLDPRASRAYHMPFNLPMQGEVDRAALRCALDSIVARHEALRTSFPAIDDEPVQKIAPPQIGFGLDEHDLRGDDDPAAALKVLAMHETAAPFDLKNGPLIRGSLVTVATDQHVLLVTMHHIVSDGWSMGIFMRELRTLYAAYRAGESNPLQPLAIQYADYAAWERGWITGDVLEAQATYWKRTLWQAPVLLNLPTDHARPALQDHQGGRVSFAIDTAMTIELKTLSRRHGTTLFMTFLTAWGALLSRLSGQDDIVVGTAVANRERPELEGLIGFFANTIALRLNYSGSPTVGELLGRVKSHAIAAQEHQAMPFEQVVEIVNPPRSLSYSPLFQTMFVWQNTERSEGRLAGLEEKALGNEANVATAKFDLSLQLSERGDEVVGTFIYATALFESASIERFSGYLRRILVAMTADNREA